MKKTNLKEGKKKRKSRNILLNDSQVKEVTIMEIRKYYNGMINTTYQNGIQSKWNINILMLPINTHGLNTTVK